MSTTRKVDRSKRIASSKVDPSNIISGTRTRKVYDYKTMTVLSENEQKEHRTTKTKTTSTEDKENVEKVVEKMSKLDLKEKKEKKSEPKPVEKVEAPIEVKPVEKKVRTKKTEAPKVQVAKTELDAEVMKQIKRLKGVYEQQVNRQYKETYDIPTTMLQFLDTTFSGELVNKKLKLPNTSFDTEFALEDDETNMFKFLREHPDAMLIGDGDKLVVTLLQDKTQDLGNFNIYILEDESPDDVQGPIKLSDFLKNSVIAKSE
eukprot:gene8796-744_t